MDKDIMNIGSCNVLNCVFGCGDFIRYCVCVEAALTSWSVRFRRTSSALKVIVNLQYWHILDREDGMTWFKRGIKEATYVKHEKLILNSTGELRFHLSNIYDAALNLLFRRFHNHSHLDSRDQNQVNHLSWTKDSNDPQEWWEGHWFT